MASEQESVPLRGSRIHPSGSEQSLSNGSYSNFDDTSIGSAASSSGHDARTTLPSLDPLPNIDPTTDGVPFRASRRNWHSNWAGTFMSRPEVYVRPKSVEEVQKAVMLARRCKRRVVVVGSGHSPSDLTCTSSWMMNLDDMDQILDVVHYGKAHSQKADGFEAVESKGGTQGPRFAGRVLVQAGLSLENLNNEMAKVGLTFSNLGSIHIQSIAGAIATATHGSALHHGLLSQGVRGLRVVLADGRAIWCSEQEQPDLFRAMLVSLGGIGIITEIEIELVKSENIAWQQSLTTLQDALSRWNTDLWTQAEFVRCWWMPYNQQVVVWKADKTDSAVQEPQVYYTGSLGFYIYHTLLTISYFVPRLLPAVEWFVMGMEYGFKPGKTREAIQEQRKGLLMDCLYSQFVNEWALPLSKGPEAITRLHKWIHGDEEGAGIPLSSKGVWVHAPIEVRVTDGSEPSNSPRGYLDPSMADGPTLYLNATLYRPYGLDPPCRERYYEAFEWLMKDVGGRPHWAKNFTYVEKRELDDMYGENMTSWLGVRDRLDPEGMFIGSWHRRYLLGQNKPFLPLEEVERRRKARLDGGIYWIGSRAIEDGDSSQEMDLLRNHGVQHNRAEA